jgi:hypothetical protein
MKCMIANTPSYITFRLFSRIWNRLALNTRILNLIFANSTYISVNIYNNINC